VTYRLLEEPGAKKNGRTANSSDTKILKVYLIYWEKLCKSNNCNGENNDASQCEAMNRVMVSEIGVFEDISTKQEDKFTVEVIAIVEKARKMHNKPSVIGQSNTFTDGSMMKEMREDDLILQNTGNNTYGSKVAKGGQPNCESQDAIGSFFDLVDFLFEQSIGERYIEKRSCDRHNLQPQRYCTRKYRIGIPSATNQSKAHEAPLSNAILGFFSLYRMVGSKFLCVEAHVKIVSIFIILLKGDYIYYYIVYFLKGSI